MQTEQQMLPDEREERPWFAAERLLIVTAHPDDEVIGLGGQLPLLRCPQFIHVTDGAPANLVDAKANGLSDRKSYARARRRELENALRLAGVEAGLLPDLGFVDQEVSLHLTELIAAVLKALQETNPSLIITHAYEGGHPDHDGTALGVHVACRRSQEEAGITIPILEMTSYHENGGKMQTAEFLPEPQCPVSTFRLNDSQRRLKQQLFGCFQTQSATLAGFGVEVERFRPAPAYDFLRPPHGGRLFYESFDWGMTGEHWRALAREALEGARMVCPA